MNELFEKYGYNYSLSMDSMLIRRILIKSDNHEVYEPSVQKLISLQSNLLEIEAYILELESQYPKNDRILINHDNMDIFKFGPNDIEKCVGDLFSKTYRPLFELMTFECPTIDIDESKIKFMQPSEQISAQIALDKYKHDIEIYSNKMKDYKMLKPAYHGDIAAQTLVVVFNACPNLFDRSSYEISYLK